MQIERFLPGSMMNYKDEHADLDAYKKTTLMGKLFAAEDWDDFDEDNGEQALDGWQVMNIKVKHKLSEQLSLTGGIDNLFDETYAISNTYKDLILLTDGSGDVMLMNEPGRYVYLNASYSF